MFKKKKLSATPTLNQVADPSANVVDQSVDLTTLTPEVNTASTNLDKLSSVPEQRQQATDNTLIICSCWPTFSANWSEIWFPPAII